MGLYKMGKGGISLSQLTKKAIVEATLKLAQTRTLSKITVRDIVEECGITRNTFYYHFHDIYEVLEDVIDAKFDSLEGTWRDNSKNAMRELHEFFNEYRKIFTNLYKSLGHEALENYLNRRLRAILMEMLHAENVRYGVSVTDLELIADFYAQGLTGQLMHRLKTELDFSIDSELFEAIFDGMFSHCLENCKKHREGNASQL